jgi:hypothetical protein
VTGGVAAAATPDEPAPRNDGHCCADTTDTTVIVQIVSTATKAKAPVSLAFFIVCVSPSDSIVSRRSPFAMRHAPSGDPSMRTV